MFLLYTFAACGVCFAWYFEYLITTATNYGIVNSLKWIDPQSFCIIITTHSSQGFQYRAARAWAIDGIHFMRSGFCDKNALFHYARSMCYRNGPHLPRLPPDQSIFGAFDFNFILFFSLSSSLSLNLPLTRALRWARIIIKMLKRDAARYKKKICWWFFSLLSLDFISFKNCSFFRAFNEFIVVNNAFIRSFSTQWRMKALHSIGKHTHTQIVSFLFSMSIAFPFLTFFSVLCLFSHCLWQTKKSNFHSVFESEKAKKKHSKKNSRLLLFAADCWHYTTDERNKRGFVLVWRFGCV